jgi:predicted transcriptional regulator
MAAKHRDRPVIHVTLSPESIAVLDELAKRWGLTRSAQLERMIREYALHEKLDMAELGRRERKARGLPKA